MIAPAPLRVRADNDTLDNTVGGDALPHLLHLLIVVQPEGLFHFDQGVNGKFLKPRTVVRDDRQGRGPHGLGTFKECCQR